FNNFSNFFLLFWIHPFSQNNISIKNANKNLTALINWFNLVIHH
ncbi:MAG: hypothetical protein ACI9Z3_001862, partial [Roseivirga sp.]